MTTNMHGWACIIQTQQCALESSFYTTVDFTRLLTRGMACGSSCPFSCVKNLHIPALMQWYFLSQLIKVEVIAPLAHARKNNPHAVRSQASEILYYFYVGSGRQCP